MEMVITTSQFGQSNLAISFDRPLNRRTSPALSLARSKILAIDQLYFYFNKTMKNVKMSMK
jgi:hypothetical protein